MGNVTFDNTAVPLVVQPFVVGGLTAIVAYSGLKMVGASQAMGEYATVGVSAGAGAAVATVTGVINKMNP